MSGWIDKIVEVIRAAVPAKDKMYDVDGIPVMINADGSGSQHFESVLKLADARQPNPRFLAGTAKHTELDSFIAHVCRFKDADSAIFADTNMACPSLTAVLDYSPPSGENAKPRWGRHKAIYTCPLSRQWKEWMQIEGVELEQDKFGDFLEAHEPELAAVPITPGEDYPSAAALIQMARDLRVDTKGTYQKQFNPTTGSYALVCKNEVETTSTKIPPRFKIALPVFDQGSWYSIEAHLRFQLKGGRSYFTVLFPTKADKFVDAFNGARSAAAAGTGLPVFAGTPE